MSVTADRPPTAESVVTVALAGDTMLGRNVGERLAADPSRPLFSDEVRSITNEADLFVLNLECAISDRGERWPDPDKPFFFRAPPCATEVLRDLGVDGVTLANNHLLDYGPIALRDTIDHLDRAGIAHAGAGADADAAIAPMTVQHGDTAIAIISVADHPPDFAATPDRPGTAYVDLRSGVPGWLTEQIGSLAADPDVDIVIVSPHWGPNMVPTPRPHVVAAAREFVAAGATLVAGHSAHVFHGVAGSVLYDLGDFVDDYAINPVLRNDLGLLFVVTFVDRRPSRIDAFPLALDYCSTRLATGAERAWIEERFTRACRDLGTAVSHDDGPLVIEVDPG